MLPVYVCEDDPAARTHVADVIEKYILIESLDMRLQPATANPQDILEGITKERTRGIYFLDIDLSADMNGFDLAKEIRRIDARGFIIFITTHGELAFETFKYKIEAMDYILKDEPQQIPSRIRQCLMSINERMLTGDRGETEYFTIRQPDEIRYMKLDDIIYFETSAAKHKVLLVTEHSCLEFFDNLKSIEERVGGSFIRCHRSFLIHKRHIVTVNYKDSTVLMTNGKQCLLSRSGKKELLTMYQ
ncbi:LytTR family DNA-binding domain-containing protein [Paenibacillus sp. MMS20-IR301]|uniref:LytR/AlgR family response regulator transcription factor n=1 Tax=Paenibacillus sp. MMS20-IR301 TaxID=2895946 RepID=UPI0028EAC419|nr:LytTR family DNA-binding domain-containing protein [Paenibacillus sp. MMS20-IR301]WNS40769.1 LytTR family DNA-binding domain-containing protein [Paenibacillus sp. MMS20-IR301]